MKWRQQERTGVGDDSGPVDGTELPLPTNRFTANRGEGLMCRRNDFCDFSRDTARSSGPDILREPFLARNRS